MKIGIVTTWTERGASYVSRQYAQALQHEHQLFIYARGGENPGKGSSVWEGMQVTWGKRVYHHWAMAIDRKDFERWLARNEIHLVIFNEQSWWPPVQWANELGVATAAYVDYYTADTVPLFAAYDLLLCNTRRHLSAFDWHPHALYIPWGTDTQLFPRCERTEAPGGEVVFFHSAGMSPYRKGTDLVVKAFSTLSGAAKLIVHTQASLVDELPDLSALADELVRDDRLQIVHETVGAPGLYCRGDVYVYPSRLDGIGLTIAEALSSGLPVIVPDYPPMNEFCDENSGRVAEVKRVFSRGDGYYWPQCEVDISSLAEQMQYYLDNIARLRTFQEQARSYAERRLDWQENSRELSSKLSELSEAARRSDKRSAHDRIREYERRRAYTLKRVVAEIPAARRFVDLARRARTTLGGGSRS